MVIDKTASLRLLTLPPTACVFNVHLHPSILPSYKHIVPRAQNRSADLFCRLMLRGCSRELTS